MESSSCRETGDRLWLYLLFCLPSYTGHYNKTGLCAHAWWGLSVHMLVGRVYFSLTLALSGHARCALAAPWGAPYFTGSDGDPSPPPPLLVKEHRSMLRYASCPWAHALLFKLICDTDRINVIDRRLAGYCVGSVISLVIMLFRIRVFMTALEDHYTAK